MVLLSGAPPAVGPLKTPMLGVHLSDARHSRNESGAVQGAVMGCAIALLRGGELSGRGRAQADLARDRATPPTPSRGRGYKRAADDRWWLYEDVGGGRRGSGGVGEG